VKEKKIFDALTEVREDYIDEARTTMLKKQPFRWKKWTAIAASLAVVLGIGIMMIQNGLPYGGSSEGGGAGHADGSIFMSYAGPVFPLTLSETENDIIVDRNISYDFSLPDEESLRVWGANVEDSYTLTNTSAEEKTVNAIYPFAGSFRELQKVLPTILVDGQQLSAKLYAGGYSGDFTGVYGADNPNGSENILPLDSWEGYKALMEDGSYKRNAFSPYPDLPQKVTVYTFTDFEAPEEYDAATQAISFAIDPDKTTIMQYGFEGGEYREDGFRRFSYFVPDNEQWRRKTKLLIVLGDDIGDYTLQGYKDGGCEEGNELDGVSVTVTRSEQILSDVILKLIDDFFKQFDDDNKPAVSQEMFLGAVSEFFYQYGLLSESVRDRYQYGMLEDILSETDTLQRVFYLEFHVTIPAEGSVPVTADLHKDPSYDFACSGSNNEGIQGYDMVTHLGSNLFFNKLTAELISTENIDIVRQNCGFDLSQGITKVELDPDLEHYYLEIRPVE
jgi:hypothetical protein